MGSLVETVTETRIKKSVNIEGPGHSQVSVVPCYEGNKRVSIVIGARHEKRGQSIFNRATLTELIEDLTEVRDAL